MKKRPVRRASSQAGHELDKAPSKSRFSRQICANSAGLRSRSGSNPLGRKDFDGSRTSCSGLARSHT
jgi:hypothetical protein